MKRIIAILLTVAVIFAVLPVIPVSAADTIWYNDPIAYIYEDYRQEPYGLDHVGYYNLEKVNSMFDHSSSDYDDLFQYDIDEKVSIYVKLLVDCTTKYFPQYHNADVNIDLNGHTWTVTNAYSNFYSYKNITISGGTMIFQNSPSCPIYTCGGDVSIRNVVFKDCVCGSYGLIAVESTGKKAPTVPVPSEGVIDQRFTEKQAKSIGSLHLDNVRFENCTSTSYGACVYVDSDQTDPMTFNNCKFINCSSNYGGALYLDSDNNTYKFTNCEFDNCFASTDGGAIYCDSEDSKLNFTNCNAYCCHADDCGGFVFIKGERTVYNGAGDALTSTFSQRSNILSCYALDSGGAFYSSVNDSCSNYSEVRNFNMAYNTAGAAKHDFNVVKSNDSNSWGGAVCFRGTDMKLAYCDLYSNYAPYYGGAVYCGYRRTSVENCAFYENRCNDGYGNDIYLDSSTQYVTGCTFYNKDNSVAGYNAAKWENNITTPAKKENLFSGVEIEEDDYIINCAVDEKYSVEISGGKDSVDKEGANVDLWENGEAEVFTVTKDAASGAYIIKSKLTGLVLDVVGATRENGANIQQSKDTGADTQRWVFEEAGNGNYYIRCLGGQYMDADGIVNGKKPTNGVNIQSWSFNGGSNQQFKLVKANEIEEGDYIFHLAYNEKYTMNISHGRSVANYKNAEFIILNNGDDNVFTITKDPVKDAYIIKAKNSDLVLQVPEGYSNYNFATINQAEYNGTDRQRWAFESVGKGCYAIRCLDGMNMGIWGSLPANGYPICSFEFNLSWQLDAGDQKFRLEKVSGDTKTTSVTKADTPNGTEKRPYKISNADQWKQFALNVSLGETYKGKYFELTNDISISYIPVGNYNQGKAFKGTLDGKNHTVHYLDFSEDWDRGLFSCCNGATIKNLRVTGKIYGTESLAGISAGADNTTFENCINDANIKSINAPYVAGISAKTNGCKFIGCVNNGEIQCEKDFAGGIAAQTFGKSEFTDCRNNGSIYAKGLDVGGILGIAQNDITVKKCVNDAPVTAGNATAAGIVGSCQQGADIISCINTEKGVISSKQYAAGMLAWAASSSDDINIKNCANSGEIKDTAGECGGIAVNHKNDNMTVANCFNATTKIPYIQKTAIINEIEEGDYIIVSALDENYAVDIENGNNAKNIPGKNAHLWQNGDANVFTVTKDKNKNAYIIKSKVTGLVLDVVNSSKENGANIQQWESNGTDAQRWVFEPANNGYCYIRCLGGQYMDASGMVGGAKPTNGVNIQSWSYTGDINQQFRLVRVNDIPEGDYVIYTALNEKMALDIDGGKGSVNVSGRNVHLWENGDANVFTVTKDKNKNAYIIKSKVTSLVLDVANGSKKNGANIQQWGNNGTDAQRWVFEYAGNGYYYIRCLGGQYMDVFNWQTNNGANINSWQFTGTDNQKFKLVKVNADEIEEGDYIITSALDERYNLDIYGGKAAVNAGGANVHLWENGDANVFTVTKDKNKNAYIIKSKITGLVLDVAGGSKDNGANVQQWGDNGSDPQRWVFENTGNGCYYIRCLGGQYMDASGMTNGVKPTNGVNIQSWSFTGATNQQFKLIKVSNTTGAIASLSSKGTYTNCYYLSGGVGDDRATALSLADCGETLKTNMNTYIAKNVTGKETADWALWQTNSETGISLPDLENVYAKNIKGEGTAEKPFLISSSNGLKELARNIEYGIDYTGMYFRLTENFAYTGTPIGTQEKPFTGIFDGNGHLVTVYMGGQTYTALFGVLVNGTVKNLKVSGSVQGAGSTAAIVGSAYNAHIDNCLVTADVIGTDANVGGVVGLLNLSTVSNCRMEGTVKNSSWTSTGGIVGGVITDGKLINCVFTGKVTGDKAVGGLVGCVMYGDPMIVNCASGGATAEYTKGGGYEHGGIVGFINSEINTMTISNCFSNCAMGIAKDSGIVVGNNQKAEKVFTDHIYYKDKDTGSTSNTLGAGYKLEDNVDNPITRVSLMSDKKAEPLTKNTYTDKALTIKKEIDGIKLTSWKRDGSFLEPQSYVQVSSLVASVFSAQNLPILIVSVIGLVAGVVGVTVMYRKKKKKSSMNKQ